MVLRIIRDIQLIKWPVNDIKTGLLPSYNLSTNQKSKMNGERNKKFWQVLLSKLFTLNKKQS